MHIETWYGLLPLLVLVLNPSLRASVKVLTTPPPNAKKGLPEEMGQQLFVMNTLNDEVRVRYATTENPAVITIVSPKQQIEIKARLDKQPVQYSIGDGSNLFIVSPNDIRHNTITITLPPAPPASAGQVPSIPSAPSAASSPAKKP